MSTTPPHPDHAVVIGAGIAGLLAAHVLARHFTDVTVIDRDHFSDQPEPRKGTPQSHHIHILLQRGLLAFEQFFPGFGQELAQAGAPTVDWTADLAMYTPPGWSPRFPSGLSTYTCSRALLEFILRKRVAAHPNISFLQGCEAIGLVGDQNKTSVIGIEVHARDQGNRAEIITGDLVVDASGRASHALQWLSSLGYSTPFETVINSFLGYATRFYKAPANFNPGWKVLMIRSRPPLGTRTGVVFPVEGGQWIVNLGGSGSERPPIDEVGFLEFARQLIHPALYEAIQNAEPITPIHGFRLTTNRLRHCDLLQRWPQNFLLIGDAFCGFNPLYAQGMTVAALETQALEEWFDHPQDSLAFQKLLAKIVHTPWLMATTEDSRIPGVEGIKAGRFERLIFRYLDEVQTLAASDQTALRTFMQVSHLTAPPTALLHPAIAVKVMRQILRHSPSM